MAASPPAAFAFAPRAGRLDFRALSRLDLPAIMSSNSPAALQPLLANVVFSRVSAEELGSEPEECVARLRVVAGALQAE